MVSQKSTACAGDVGEADQCGASFVSFGSSPFIASALDLPTIWMLPTGQS